MSIISWIKSLFMKMRRKADESAEAAEPVQEEMSRAQTEAAVPQEEPTGEYTEKEEPEAEEPEMTAADAEPAEEIPEFDEDMIHIRPLNEYYTSGLTEEEKWFLRDHTAELRSRIRRLRPFEAVDITPPAYDEDVIYLPVEGTYNIYFYTRMYMLRNHEVGGQIISRYGQTQYQIPVRADNEELCLLVYGGHFFGELLEDESDQQIRGVSKCLDTDEKLTSRPSIFRVTDEVRRFIRHGDDPLRMVEKAALETIEYRDWLQAMEELTAVLDAGFTAAMDELKVRFLRPFTRYTEGGFFEYVRNAYIEDTHDIDPDELAEGLPYPVMDLLNALKEISKRRTEQQQAEADKAGDVLTVVRKYTLDGDFVAGYTSAEEAAEAGDLPLLGIIRCLSGMQKSSGGYIWRREPADTEPGVIDPEDYEPGRGGVPKKVIQINQDGEYVATYESIARAAQTVGIDPKGIRDVLRGTQKTAGGYYWKYYD